LNKTEKDAETAVAHSEFLFTLDQLTIDEIRFLRRQFQIGNISGKDRESDLFSSLAKFSGKRTDGDAVRVRLGISVDSAIEKYFEDLEHGDTPSSSEIASRAVEWCDEIFASRSSLKTFPD